MSPIKVPRNERPYEQPRERRRTVKQREFGDSLREGFADKAAKRRERQEARGIPAKAPTPATAEDAQLAAAKRKIARGLAAEAQGHS
jgi:hypothetical protein